MVSPSGGRHARRPMNGSESSNSVSSTTNQADDVKSLLGSSEVTLDDTIAMHLVDCDQCRKAIASLTPVGLGQKSGHCSVYWNLQLMRANYEGAANNIVAYTEFGDEARKGRPLE